jgi:hypothetical protein
MPNRDFWDKNVPRVEHDHHARDARLRLEHAERLLAKRAGRRSAFGLLRLVFGNIAGSGRRPPGQRTGRPKYRQPRGIGLPWPTSLILIT